MYKILLVVHFPQTFHHNLFQHNFNYQAVEYLEKFLYIELRHHLLVGAALQCEPMSPEEGEYLPPGSHPTPATPYGEL